MKIKHLIASAFLLFTLPTFAQLADGSGIFDFSHPPLHKKDHMRIFYHKPAGDVANMPVLFVMHGINRNADTYRDNWVKLSEKHKILVIVPEFSNELFPRSGAYNLGNVRIKSGRLNDESEWAYSLIDPIFEEVVRRSGSKQQKYDLFGHSAGSQFAHRFLLFMKDTKANRIIAANAGTYMALERDVQYPWGLKGTNLSDEHLKAVLAREVVIHLGEKDIDPAHRHLNVTPQGMRQGKHRFERGHFFYETAKKLAEELGTDFNWKIRTVPNAAHSNARMANDIAGYLYGN